MPHIEVFAAAEFGFNRGRAIRGSGNTRGMTDDDV